MDDPVDRASARVLLVDDDDRVLLFRGCDPSDPAAGSWWFTPGGGLEPDEAVRDGAVRELLEETGLRLDPAALVGPVHQETVEFSLGGTRYRQTGEFYLARVPACEVDTAGFSEFEQSFVLEHRWWTRDELRATGDTVYPACLIALLDGPS